MSNIATKSLPWIPPTNTTQPSSSTSHTPHPRPISHCVLSSFFPLTPSISSTCSYNEDSHHLQFGSHWDCEGQVYKRLSFSPHIPAGIRLVSLPPSKGYSRYGQTEQNEPNGKSYIHFKIEQIFFFKCTVSHPLSAYQPEFYLIWEVLIGLLSYECI